MFARRFQLRVVVREGEIVEVLKNLGLAHVLSRDGMCYAVNKQTPGIDFEELRVGMRVCCIIAKRFSRVLYASVVV